MAEPIKFTWEEIYDFKVDKKGVELKVKEADYPKPEGKASESKAPELGGYPKPLSTDALDIVLDESKFVINDAGALVIPDVVLAKEIVQDYDGKMVYKPKEEIEKMIQYMDHLPITNGHPETGLIAGPDQVLGFVLNPRFVDGCAIGDIEVNCSDLIKDIKEGKKRQVSLGFQSDIIDEAGKWEDMDYQAIQRNIFPDHEAIVEIGRCSMEDGCGLTPESMEKSVVKEAKDVVDSAKKKLIDEITSKTKAKKKDELKENSLDELKTSLDFIKKVEAEQKTAEKLKAGDSHKSGAELVHKAYAEHFGEY